MATNLTTRGPFRDVSPVQQEIQQMFRQMLGDEGDGATEAGAWIPALDVEEDDDAFRLHVELPGVAPEDVELTLEDDVLTIAGQRDFYDEREADDFKRIERRYGRFRRAVRLPARVDPDAIQARAEGGMLEVTVPKSEQARPRRIEITSG